MNRHRPHFYFSILPVSVLILLSLGMLRGQAGYHVTQYTSREGLPQNSIRGMAFDNHGFLWLGTEGGIARFDGRSFKVFNADDYPPLVNQRYKSVIKCGGHEIMFLDQLEGAYMLTDDRFSTLQQPSSGNFHMYDVVGGNVDPYFLLKDSLFIAESKRTEYTAINKIYVFPSKDTHKYYVINDRIVLVDRVRGSLQVIDTTRSPHEKYFMIRGTLLRMDGQGQLERLVPESNRFEICALTDANGMPWKGLLVQGRVFNEYPLEEAFITDADHLYRISGTYDPQQYTIQKILDQLPENSIINDIAYRVEDEVLVLGTDTRGIFVYEHQYFKTAIKPNTNTDPRNAYYAQSQLNDQALLTSYGWILNPQTFTWESYQPGLINSLLIVDDKRGGYYYTKNRDLYRNDLKHKRDYPMQMEVGSYPYCVTLIDSTFWVGTLENIGYIRDDSVINVLRFPKRAQGFGIKYICKDAEQNIWFSNFFQLYRFNRNTSQLDSFAVFNEADCRGLAYIRDHLFIGTYGKGFFVFHHGQFVHMPAGRNNELAHTHAFIEADNGYLWIMTNRGLFKTHLDAIDSYLQDTTRQLDYYLYQEEDGIVNTEFNGGCSPPYLWLNDGRLSLPTMEGLVIFRPGETKHHFTRDTILLESIDVDRKFYSFGQELIIPASHSNITIHFAGAWWGRPYNQYIYYKIEGTAEDFRLCQTDQASIAIGHLSPGDYTFVIKRRCGFGPDDFVWSRAHFTVARPWYAQIWVLSMIGFAFLIILWATAALYARSIRKRNIALQHKVDEQTRELLHTNAQLEVNLTKLSASDQDLRNNIRVRDRLISIITHDILTPLKFIGQIARLGADHPQEETNNTKQALTDVQNAVHKLFHSTQNLLHWVNFQKDQLKISAVNCSPFALVEQLIEDFREMARYQENVLINEVPEDDVIISDPRILSIVLHNLLSNAIKYTQHGSITVRSGVENHSYILEVRDTGRGMTTAQLEQIRRGNSKPGEYSLEDVTAGNGIGLSLIADLMKTLQGRWEIDSPEGKGVSVRIFIPLSA